MWVKDQIVVAAKPRPELDCFFRMKYEKFVEEVCERSGSARVERGRERGLMTLIAT